MWAEEGALHLLFLVLRRADEESLPSGERLVGSSDPPHLLLFHPLSLTLLFSKLTINHILPGKQSCAAAAEEPWHKNERKKEAKLSVRLIFLTSLATTCINHLVSSPCKDFR